MAAFDYRRREQPGGVGPAAYRGPRSVVRIAAPANDNGPFLMRAGRGLLRLLLCALAAAVFAAVLLN